MKHRHQHTGTVMSSKDVPYFGICTFQMKRQFTFEGATKVSKLMRRKHDSNHHSYRCQSCDWWHVGSHDRFERQAKSATGSDSGGARQNSRRHHLDRASKSRCQYRQATPERPRGVSRTTTAAVAESDHDTFVRRSRARANRSEPRSCRLNTREWEEAA